MGEKVRGRLLIIGGGENKDGKPEILRCLVRLAGGGRGRLVVMTVASQDQDAAGEEYRRVFERLGLEVEAVVKLTDRPDAGLAVHLEALARATAVFFTGGDQLRITSTLGGTPLDDLLHRRFSEGLVVAGTSAGAAAMSDTMIVGGREEDPPQPTAAEMCPGLGFIEEVVIDQHFADRGRIGRLLSVVARNPYVLGLGIDENTAVEVDPSGKLQVVGEQTITVLDGREVTHTNVSEVAPDQSLALTGVKLHVLPAPYGFDLKTRRPIIPREGSTTPAGA